MFTKLKQKLQGVGLKMAKPLIKSFLIASMNDNRLIVMDTLSKKIDIPKMTPKEESKLFNQLYDALQESLTIIIERV